MRAFCYILFFGLLGQFILVGKPMVVAHRGASGEAPEN
ncbi:MAG TPA: glycerophosphodiester phosphodiesterase, partial [Verrucomicrobiales bacterium]|nr:glycerophosphodiester phosphodiesterase [Verrucomicrobiales bacterium]